MGWGFFNPWVGFGVFLCCLGWVTDFWIFLKKPSPGSTFTFLKSLWLSAFILLLLFREESPYTNKRYELFERDLFKPVAPVKKIEVKQAPEPRNKTISFESTTPWNATGFYYTPRYPQSHRGKKIFFLIQNYTYCIMRAQLFTELKTDLYQDRFGFILKWCLNGIFPWRRYFV